MKTFGAHFPSSGIPPNQRARQLDFLLPCDNTFSCLTFIISTTDPNGSRQDDFDDDDDSDQDENAFPLAFSTALELVGKGRVCFFRELSSSGFVVFVDGRRVRLLLRNFFPRGWWDRFPQLLCPIACQSSTGERRVVLLDKKVSSSCDRPKKLLRAVSHRQRGRQSDARNR